MPDIESSDRYQTAVLWAAGGYDDYGEQTVGDPVEVQVRWVNNRSEALDANGNMIAIDATVVLAQDVAIGDKMWLGTLDDLPGTGYQPDEDVMEVVTFGKTPDLKGRFYRREAGLKRFRDTLPEG